MKAPCAAGNFAEVLKPGAMTTVQDLGRVGFLNAGVPDGGAMDRLAARVANLLVGNPASAALLETTMAGPVLRFHSDALIAVCGARFNAVPAWQPLMVKAGDELDLTGLETGCRGYLAVAGGFVVPAAMGSASTYLRAGVGGVEGRALRKGDRLQIGPALHATPVDAERWHVSPSVLPAYSTQPVVRVVRGAQWDWFAEEAQYKFFEGRYSVLPKSDRMGLRLIGAQLLLKEPREMVSEAVAFGSVQVPPEGQPIVLMADRQTIGGYPRIAEVASVDLPLLAQLRPGDRLMFTLISLDEAQSLLLAAEHALGHLQEGLSEKYS
ncbi:MAG: biotin-dependent carboxyltransferase family protein [Nibricoccus sp.]